MTTVTRLLASLLVTVVAATTAVHLIQDQGSSATRRADAVTVVAELSAPADLAPIFDLGDFDAATQEVIRASIGLYEEAGLTLPAIRFVDSDDPEDCRGRDGMVIHRSSGPELRLCHDELTPTLERVVIHELAHCWDRHQLTDAGRQAFLDLRGLEGWREGEWSERGAEHAAEIMVWGLIDRPVRPRHINQTSCEALTDGYMTLTCQEPLHGHCDLCP